MYYLMLILPMIAWRESVACHVRKLLNQLERRAFVLFWFRQDDY